MGWTGLGRARGVGKGRGGVGGSEGVRRVKGRENRALLESFVGRGGHHAQHHHLDRRNRPVPLQRGRMGWHHRQCSGIRYMRCALRTDAGW